MTKYGNKYATVNGIRFDSRKEAARYSDLLLLLKAGEIANLKLQPNFTLVEAFTTPDGERIPAIAYRADFMYHTPSGQVIEDVKGVRTEAYRLKYRMMADKGHHITEV